jgi:hypothetical protein
MSDDDDALNKLRDLVEDMLSDGLEEKFGVSGKVEINNACLAKWLDRMHQQAMEANDESFAKKLLGARRKLGAIAHGAPQMKISGNGAKDWAVIEAMTKELH